jgi:DnaJ domain
MSKPHDDTTATHTNTSTDKKMNRPPPSEALMQLWSPDGYYTYLGVPKQPSTSTTTDNGGTTANASTSANDYKDRIKKSYRKLSLKHHPDRNGGDAETFRVLNRAQKVLTNPKLRQQYDILGLDLDDEEEDNNHDHAAKTGTTNTGTNTEDSDGGDEDGGESSSSSASQGIVNEMAQMALTVVMQMGVRTGT